MEYISANWEYRALAAAGMLQTAAAIAAEEHTDLLLRVSLVISQQFSGTIDGGFVLMAAHKPHWVEFTASRMMSHLVVDMSGNSI